MFDQTLVEFSRLDYRLQILTLSIFFNIPIFTATSDYGYEVILACVRTLNFISVSMAGSC